MHFTRVVSALAVLLLSGLQAQSGHPWNLGSLHKAPAHRWLDADSPIRSVLYEGEQYQGNKTEVFAFYATPDTLAGKKSDKQFPGVVLIHGGGGTAFAEWVELWAKRGYAAIAMDLSGRSPDAPKFDPDTHELLVVRNHRDIKRTRLEHPGPDHGHAEKFDSIGDPQDMHWPYHAVASVIRAHSLIRSFPEVDKDRTAVTGISWGGYTTCIVASVDSRFKAAVPVYGCGFLYEGESVQKPAIDKQPPPLWKKWVELYDPSSHLDDCTVPILFVNGTNDKHYPLDSYMRSYALPRGYRNLRIEPNMRHSHPHGWAPKEIGMFIDSFCMKAKKLPKLGAPQSESGMIVMGFESTSGATKAELHFTTGNGPLVDRKWQSQPAKIAGKRIITPQPPKNATIWFLTLTDERDAMVSSEVYFNEAP